MTLLILDTNCSYKYSTRLRIILNNNDIFVNMRNKYMLNAKVNSPDHNCETNKEKVGEKSE
jgi:hypothetical protein